LSRPMSALALNSLALTRPARLRATKANGTVFDATARRGRGRGRGRG